MLHPTLFSLAACGLNNLLGSLMHDLCQKVVLRRTAIEAQSNLEAFGLVLMAMTAQSCLKIATALG